MIATTETNVALLDEASRLASLGWRVFPLRPGSKLPWQGSHGVLDATSDQTQIQKWWTSAPASNIGLAMGGGAIAVDVDPGAVEAYGADAVGSLEFDSAGAPKQATPRGGFHLFYKFPAGVAARNWVGEIGAGLDIRSDGGYVVVAPSYVVDRAKGIDGGYEWVEPIECSPGQLTEPPAWLITALNNVKKPCEPTPGGSPNATGGPIPEGKRNCTLASVAGSMRMLGHSAEGIEAALEVLNQERCVPPLPEREVEKIARSVGRYEPDERAQRAIEAGGGQRVSDDPSSAAIRNLDKVEPERVSWLWPGRIPLGKLTVLAGLPGLGKSVLSLSIASRVSTGSDWPDGENGIGHPGGVVLVSAEDDLADTVVPRLLAAGADMSRINALDGYYKPDGVLRPVQFSDINIFGEAIAQTPDCRLLVIDPVSAFVGGDADSYKDSDVRGLLAPLATLAADTGVAVLLVAHLNKSSGGAAIHRISGAGAWGAAARAAWLVSQSPDDPDDRLLLALKTNLARRTHGLNFTIVDHFGLPAIAWSGAPINESADDILRRLGDGRHHRESPAEDDAVEFLKAELEDEPDGVMTTELKRRARDAGLSWRTIKRAKQSLGFKAQRRGGAGADGAWWWSLRAAGDDAQG